MREKLSTSIKSEENPDGYLVQADNLYLNCLTLKIDELEDLFSQDESHWVDQLQEAKESKEKAQSEIVSLLQQNL